MFPIRPVINKASNIKGGTNPPFAADDFKKIYPHFYYADGICRVPEEVLDMYIEFAHACLKEKRYKKAWKMAMGLFVAHFLLLYMQSLVDPECASATVIQAGQTKGLTTSKTVDGVSVSYDFSTALADLDGWASWKLTNYGVQLATLAKTYGMGGMYVW